MVIRACEHSHLLTVNVYIINYYLARRAFYFYLCLNIVVRSHSSCMFFVIIHIVYRNQWFIVRQAMFGVGRDCPRWSGDARQRRAALFARGCMTNPINSTNECCRTYTIYVSSQLHCKYLVRSPGRLASPLLVLSPHRAWKDSSATPAAPPIDDAEQDAGL